ncbi:uncharacterized protein LOC143818271 [Ranitomeya variabilis]|uniref:uncharacterized protein LOC143818271 n=1 Tax=Ranitomeya variabilis TaxID=490064 RepID=UPI0040559E64
MDIKINTKFGSCVLTPQWTRQDQNLPPDPTISQLFPEESIAPGQQESFLQLHGQVHDIPGLLLARSGPMGADKVPKIARNLSIRMRCGIFVNQERRLKTCFGLGAIAEEADKPWVFF